MAIKLCGLYIRVSTEKQASVEEGSLKNQDYLLSQHIELKSKLSQERWTIVERYVDEGRSAKDTNRPAYQRMIADVESGRINTVLCLALSRITRSTKDLLEMVEFFKRSNVDFICLKEDVDTTTPVGRLLLTLMGGVNQFEREQTGERTRAAFQARAERGLWNGGQISGYDLDPNRKGYLLVSEKESQIVNFAFDTYLETGSVCRTQTILNERGYRTKSYTSRRGKPHASTAFTHSSVYKILTNLAYIGKKEINKSVSGKPWNREPQEESGYRVVDAVWSGIVDEEKFNEVQKLLRQNCKTHNNGSAPNKHFYLLNGGLLYCYKCGSVMGGRNGHGHRNRKAYYYYVCRNQKCQTKFPQEEVERILGALISQVAQSQTILPKVTLKLNERLQKALPLFESQTRAKETELSRVKEEAQKLLSENDWRGGGKIFVDEQLQRLAENRKRLDEELGKLRSELTSIKNNELATQEVEKLLQDASDAILNDLKPYKRKDLLSAAVQRFEISEDICKAEIKLGSATLDSGWSNGQTAFAQASGGAILGSNFLSPG